MKRMRTNDSMLRYKRLPCNIFSCTLISRTASKRRNKYTEVFEIDFGWSQAYPMKTKGNNNEDILLILQRMGVPDHLIVDKSKEQGLVSFKNNCSEAGFHLK